jgi:type II secretory pathway predicted ATPase ExeA
MSLEKIRQSLGLTGIPFSKEILVNHLYAWDSTRDALARLEAALENEDSALLIGPPGSGKSCVVRRFVHGLDDKHYRPVYLCAENTKPGDIAKQVLVALGFEVPFHGAKAIRELKRCVTSLYFEKGIKPVAIFDEAQDLPIATLLAIKTFLNYEMDSRNCLFLLLCGQSEIENTLRMPVLEAISRRIRIRCKLRPLSLEDTSKYIRHQMKQVGMDRQYYSDEAVSRIFEYSKGIVSAINHFCFNAMVLAVSEGKELVDPGAIETLRGKE